MKKELEWIEEGLEVNIHIDLLRARTKNYQIGKCLAIMANMNSGLKNSSSSMTDWFCNWVNAYKRLAYSKDDEREN